MMLQEEVKFDMYFRCYSIDQRHVRIMPYEPRHPYHLRYQTEWKAPKKILEQVEQGVLTLNQYLGYDLNTVEFAIRDGVPVAIDFCNPAPDAEAARRPGKFRVGGGSSFRMAIRKAREHVPGRDNLSWGKYLQAPCMAKGARRKWRIALRPAADLFPGGSNATIAPAPKPGSPTESLGYVPLRNGYSVRTG